MTECTTTVHEVQRQRDVDLRITCRYCHRSSGSKVELSTLREMTYMSLLMPPEKNTGTGVLMRLVSCQLTYIQMYILGSVYIGLSFCKYIKSFRK